MIPSDCIIGTGMIRRLLLRALSPLVLIVAVPLVSLVLSISRHCATFCGSRGRLQSLGRAMVSGLLDGLPTSLVLSFCFTPSVSASIFRAWHCIPFVFDNEQSYSYLAQDLTVRCDGSDEHGRVLAVACILVVLWPIGMVFLYAVLILPCRYMLLDEAPPTPLLTATKFLHKDYKPAYFWWEVISLCQRTTLTGWLLLIDVENAFLRLVAALMISIAFLVRLDPHTSQSRTSC